MILFVDKYLLVGTYRSNKYFRYLGTYQLTFFSKICNLLIHKYLYSITFSDIKKPRAKASSFIAFEKKNAVPLNVLFLVKFISTQRSVTSQTTDKDKLLLYP